MSTAHYEYLGIRSEHTADLADHVARDEWLAHILIHCLACKFYVRNIVDKELVANPYAKRKQHCSGVSVPHPGRSRPWPMKSVATFVGFEDDQSFYDLDTALACIDFLEVVAVTQRTKKD